MAPRGHNLTGPTKPILEGPAHPQWKGDHASTQVKRKRARRAFELGPCEMCGAQATDRHHVDGDTGNNERANIATLCRRCHMKVDGRLDRLAKAPRSQPQAPKPCANCGRHAKPLRKGRCHTCAVYFARRSFERSTDPVEATTQ